MVGGSCGVKNLFALAVPVWRVCARVAPQCRSVGVVPKRFRGIPGGGKKKVCWVGSAPTAQRERCLGAFGMRF